MARLLLSVLVLAAAAAVASGDRLVLVDGREFEGTVRIEDETVVIEMAYGTLKFRKSQVLRIELKDTPEVEFAKRLAAIDPKDTDAMFKLAQEGARKGLKKQAREVYDAILRVDPDHAETRRALGQVKIDGQWRTYDKGYELARSKLEAGSYGTLSNNILPELLAIAESREQAFAVRELIAETHLRSKDFTSAAEGFAELSEKTTGLKAIRCAAVADILRESPDGMYVLREPYPPGSPLLGDGEKAVPAGPASLSEPLVLKAALRDRAKADIEAGRKLLEAARSVESTDPDAAKKKYAQAQQHFDRADALIPGISRSFRIEIARRRIAGVRKDIETYSKRFDELMGKLGKEDLSPKVYRLLLQRMIHHLDNIEERLKKILALSEPYPRDLVLEVKWAELDMKRIAEMRKVLKGQLDGK